MNPQQSISVRLGRSSDGDVYAQHSASKDNKSIKIMDFAAFLSAGSVDNVTRIDLLAIAENAELVVALFDRKLSGLLAGDIWLGPPSAALSDTNPLGLFSVSRPPSVGGWRLATATDLLTCKLISLWRREDVNSFTIQHELRKLVSCHPAWPALSFPLGGDLLAGVELLIRITDPRWYKLPERPDTLKGLFAAFGLGTSGLANMLSVDSNQDSIGVPEISFKRYLSYCVLSAWAGAHRAAPNITKVKNNEFPNQSKFFWKVCKENGDGAKGLLAASRVFLRFIHDVWLDNLTPQREYKRTVKTLGRTNPSRVAYKELQPVNGYVRQLFVPSYLFGDDKIVERMWDKHYVRWQLDCSNHLISS